MKKITFKELCKWAEQHTLESLPAVIVYDKSNWEDDYTEIQRSYRVYSDAKFFDAAMIGRSLFGFCLDGSDQGVRLDLYGWKVEYCYLEEERRDEIL